MWYNVVRTLRPICVCYILPHIFHFPLKPENDNYWHWLLTDCSPTRLTTEAEIPPHHDDAPDIAHHLQLPGVLSALHVCTVWWPVMCVAKWAPPPPHRQQSGHSGNCCNTNGYESRLLTATVLGGCSWPLQARHELRNKSAKRQLNFSLQGLASLL